MMIQDLEYKEVDSKIGRYQDTNGNEVHWTRILHDNAYNHIKEKWPVLIPSYSSPNPVAVSKVLANMSHDSNWPIIIFVRDSQKDQYIEANTNKYVKVVSMQDSLITDAGLARKESLKWLYSMGFDHAFSFDDDILGIGMTEAGVTGKGDPKSVAIKDTNICNVLASWQLAMMALEDIFDNVALTAPYPIGFSWKKEYCWSSESALLYRGNLNQVVCLNVKNIVDNDIMYESNKLVGHEDIDINLQCLDKHLMLATFPFIWYSTPPMNIDNFKNFGSTMNDRFKAQQEIMMKNWGDFPYVTFRDKRGLAQVVPNFRKYRKDYGIDPYVIDIWNDGAMLE